MPEMNVPVNTINPAALPQHQAVTAAPMLPVFNPNVKDSRWLTLEVCREYTRQKCTRTENECKFAHPPAHVEVQNGRVTCCFDSIKGKCQRKEPPCKYLHPPQHLREQLLQNGRNNLILRQLQAQAIAVGGVGPLGLPPYYLQTAYDGTANGQLGTPTTKVPYPSNTQVLSQLPVMPPFTMFQNPSAFPTNPYHLSPTAVPGMIQAVDGSGAASVPCTLSGMLPTAAGAGAQPQQKLTTRTDARIEANGSTGSDGSYTTLVSSVNDVLPPISHAALYSLQQPLVEVMASQRPLVVGEKRLRDPADDTLLLQGMNTNSMHGMVPLLKRPAMENKNGIPMYHHTQQATPSPYPPAMATMQLNQQYVPVTSMATAASPFPSNYDSMTSHQAYAEHNGLHVASHPNVPRF